MKHFKIPVFFGLALSFVEHWHGAAPDSWFTHVSIEPFFRTIRLPGKIQ